MKKLSIISTFLLFGGVSASTTVIAPIEQPYIESLYKIFPRTAGKDRIYAEWEGWGKWFRYYFSPTKIDAIKIKIPIVTCDQTEDLYNKGVYECQLNISDWYYAKNTSYIFPPPKGVSINLALEVAYDWYERQHNRILEPNPLGITEERIIESITSMKRGNKGVIIRFTAQTCSGEAIYILPEKTWKIGSTICG